MALKKPISANMFIQQQSTLDDAARRFMALVDECYEQQCLVLVSSQLPN